MKRKKPIFPKVFLEKEDFDEVVDYEIIEDFRFSNIQTGNPFHHVEFRSCVFQNVDFSEMKISKSNFIHVRFEHCDLSNLDFHETTWYCVEFVDCKFVGTLFFGSSMKNILMEGCMGSFANFNGVLFENVEIHSCVFEEGYFSELRLKEFEIDDSNFNECEFLHTPLKGIDFTSCQIHGIKIDAESLKGMIVNEFQAILLSTMLGIIIKE